MTIYCVEGTHETYTGTEEIDDNERYFTSKAEAEKAFTEMRKSGDYYVVRMARIVSAPMPWGKLVLATLNRRGWVAKHTKIKTWYAQAYREPGEKAIKAYA